jgi:hypothetical protein
LAPAQNRRIPVIEPGRKIEDVMKRISRIERFGALIARGFIAAMALYACQLSSAPKAEAQGLVYAVLANGDLMWNKHLGRDDGTFNWATDTGKQVGNGWNVKHVFSGGNGIIYSVLENGDLMWNKHLGRDDGSFSWATDTGKQVGNGWNVQKVLGD